MQRFSDRPSGLLTLVRAFAPVALMALSMWWLAPSPQALQSWPAVVLLLTAPALAAFSWFQPYTTILCSDTGFTVQARRNVPERHVGWSDVAGTQVSVQRHRRGRSGFGPNIKVTSGLTLETSSGLPVVFRRMKIGPLLDFVNAHTPHLSYEWVSAKDDDGRAVLEQTEGYKKVARHGAAGCQAPLRSGVAVVPVPTDGVAEIPHPHLPVNTKARIAALVVSVGLAAWFAPADDPLIWWLAVALPAVFIVPLTIFAAWQEYGTVTYRCESFGRDFTVTRQRFGRSEIVGQGSWADVTRTHSELEFDHGGETLTVDVAGRPAVRIPRAARYPAITAFFNERAPLPYEWILASAAEERAPIEQNGAMARVSRQSL